MLSQRLCVVGAGAAGPRGAAADVPITHACALRHPALVPPRCSAESGGSVRAGADQAPVTERIGFLARLRTLPNRPRSWSGQAIRGGRRGAIGKYPGPVGIGLLLVLLPALRAYAHASPHGAVGMSGKGFDDLDDFVAPKRAGRGSRGPVREPARSGNRPQQSPTSASKQTVHGASEASPGKPALALVEPQQA